MARQRSTRNFLGRIACCHRFVDSNLRAHKNDQIHDEQENRHISSTSQHGLDHTRHVLYVHPDSVSVSQETNNIILSVAIAMRLVLLLGSFNLTDVAISLILGAIFFPDTLLLLSSLVVSFYW